MEARQMMSNQPSPKVALLIETSGETGREILRGVLRYSQTHGPWGLHVSPGDVNDLTLPNMKAWNGTGIIARISNQAVADSVARAKLPTVVIDLDDKWLGTHQFANVIELRTDSQTIGTMAAEYFLDRNYHRFAVVGEVCVCNWSRIRVTSFCERLAEAGYANHIHHPPEMHESDWGVEQKKLSGWLRSLPKPVAVFSTTDARGRQVLDACLAEGLQVPEELAVLGVDNDEFICEIAYPSLSSIAMNTEQRAYEATEMLHMMMNRKIKKGKVIYYEPLSVITRKSTAIFHTTDAVVAKSLKFIHDNADKNIGVPEVSKAVGVSRRVLEKRFRQELNRSIQQEIQRVRFQYIQLLLLRTKMTLAEIARASGFNSENYMQKAFRKKFKMTMNQYRKQQL